MKKDDRLLVRYLLLLMGNLEELFDSETGRCGRHARARDLMAELKFQMLEISQTVEARAVRRVLEIAHGKLPTLRSRPGRIWLSKLGLAKCDIEHDLWDLLNA